MNREKKEGFGICDNKGFHITFKNGWTVSVQFGGGNYCDNYDRIFSVPLEERSKPQKCANAEVWCFSDSENYPEEPLSHQTPKDVLDILLKISRKRKKSRGS